MSKNTLLVLLLAGFILASIYLFNLPSTIALRVTESNGQSIMEAGSVLLPGERIEIGGMYRVLNSQLMINTDASRSGLKLRSGSRFRSNGIPHSGALSWTYLSGRGRTTVNKGTFVHHWNGTSSGEGTPLLVQEQGSIKWSVKSSEVRVVIGEDFVGHWVLEDRGSFLGIRSSDRVLKVKRRPVRSVQVQDDLPDDSWRPGSIMTPKKLKMWFHRKTVSGPPSSLQEIFGHWVRDRWGKPYLYIPLTDGQLLFASSGPDEKFLTDDDRKWKKRY